MTNLLGKFVSGTYLAMKGAVGVHLVLFWVIYAKIVKSVCPGSMWAIVGIWQPYLFSDNCQICVQCSFLNGWYQWLSFVSCIYTYIACVCMLSIWHMPNLVGIFVSCTYLAITGQLEVAFGCVLVYMCSMLGSKGLFSMLSVSYIWKVEAIFVQWYMSNMYIVLLAAWLMPVTSYVSQNINISIMYLSLHKVMTNISMM